MAVITPTPGTKPWERFFPDWQPAGNYADIVADGFVDQDQLPTGGVSIERYGVQGDGSDETVAVNTALANERHLYIPRDMRVSVQAARFRANSIVEGPGALVSVANNPLSFLTWVAVGDSNVYVIGLEIDGNKANQIGDPDLAATTPGCLFQAGGVGGVCNNINLIRVHGHDSHKLGLVFQNVQDGRIADCNVHDNNRDGITVYFNTRDVVISNPKVKNVGDDGIGINSGNGADLGLCERITVINPMVSGPSTRAKGPGITVRGGDQINIVGGEVSSMSQYGVYLTTHDGAPLTRSGIYDTIIDRAGQGGAGGTGIGVLCAANQPQNHPAGSWQYIRDVTIAPGKISRSLAGGVVIRDERAPAGVPTPLDDDVRDVVVSTEIQDPVGRGISIDSAGVNDIFIRSRVKGAGGAWGIGCTSAAKRIFVDDCEVYGCAADGINLQNITDGSILRAKTYGNGGTGVILSTISGVWSYAGVQAWNNTTAQVALSGFAGVTGWADKHVCATVAWDPPSVANGAATTTTINVPGALVGDSVNVGHTTVNIAGLILVGIVQATGIVAITLLNMTGAAQDRGNGTLRADVFKGSN